MSRVPSLTEQHNILKQFTIPNTNIAVISHGLFNKKLSNPEITKFIHDNDLIIPKNIKIMKPIHLLFLHYEDKIYIDYNIIIGDFSSVTIIEEHIVLNQYESHHEMNIRINTLPKSILVYYKFQCSLNKGNSNFKTTTFIEQHQESKILNYVINYGADKIQDNTIVKLIDTRSYFGTKVLNFMQHMQNYNNKISIEHLISDCASDILVKSIVNDNAIFNFDGRVIVNKNAINTNTHMINKNLLLSIAAKINTTPALEVYIDNVVCTHSATTGYLDPVALFYCRSRGISQNAAMNILIFSFMNEIMEHFAKFQRLWNLVGLTYE